MLTTILLICSIFSGIKGDDCPIDKSNVGSIRLKNDLLCGYDRTIRPVISQQNATKVLIRMILKYFSHDVHENTFTIDSWLSMFWKDEHLKWDPNKYDHISFIHLSSQEIWTPDISVYNRRDQSGDPTVIGWATCIVSSGGQVVCVPPSRQESLCVADLTRYPFDTQNCTARFGSWVHSGEEINLNVPKQAVTIDDVVPNGQWALLGTEVTKHPGKFKCCPNNTYPSINFSFKIKRLVGPHAASVVLPAVALIVITLTSLWISPNQSDRLNLCCVNLICEFLYSQYVSWLIPLNGNKIPLIILFARDSLLLSAFTIVFSVILKRMTVKEGPAPRVISTIVTFSMRSGIGQFLFLEDSSAKNIAAAKGEEDGAEILNNFETQQGNGQDWVIFANFLDRLCFLCYFITYFGMFIAFIP